MPDSLVYAESAALLQHRNEAAQRHAEGRHNAIGQRFASDEHFAPPPFEPNEVPPNFIQSKIRSNGCPQALASTHDRLFNRQNKTVAIDPDRAQRLRNLTTRGKTYDIISGAEIQVRTVISQYPCKFFLRSRRLPLWNR